MFVFFLFSAAQYAGTDNEHEFVVNALTAWTLHVFRRAIIVMRPGLENNINDPSKNLMFLAYTLERAAVQSASAGGDGRYVVIIDYAAGNFSLRNAPSLSTSKETLAIIQNHYPERLAAAFLCDSPSYFYPTFRMIKPFMDPVTAAKGRTGVVFIFFALRVHRVALYPDCYRICILLF